MSALMPPGELHRGDEIWVGMRTHEFMGTFLRFKHVRGREYLVMRLDSDRIIAHIPCRAFVESKGIQMIKSCMLIDTARTDRRPNQEWSIAECGFVPRVGDHIDLGEDGVFECIAVVAPDPSVGAEYVDVYIRRTHSALHDLIRNLRV